MKRDLNPDKLISLIKQAVRIAELLFPEAGSGAQKKAWVVQFLNDKINLPIIGEKLEAHVFGALVDLVVAFFNEAAEKWDA